MRVYCPDCDTPRKVADYGLGQRVRCRNCARVFRVGHRNEPRERLREPDDIDPGRHRTAAWVVVSVALLIVGLVVGVGVTAWYLIEVQPMPADEERFEPEAPEPPGPPPVFDRLPDPPDPD
jgi:zinc-ribbon domain